MNIDFLDGRGILTLWLVEDDRSGAITLFVGNKNEILRPVSFVAVKYQAPAGMSFISQSRGKACSSGR